MKKLNYKPILLFLLSCALIAPVFVLSSMIFNMVVSVIGLLETKYGAMLLVYFGYFLIMDYVFYGSSKKQNRHISSLEKNRKYTVLQDAKLFLKQEGIIVILSYAVFAVVAFVADEYIPGTKNLFLDFLKMGYEVPISPSMILSLPIWLEYLICVVCFSVLYCLVILWHRARIRKKWHS